MKNTKRLFSLILVFALLFSTFEMVRFSASTSDTKYSVKHIQNGSFEENVESFSFQENIYTQPNKTSVPYWDTTAYDGKFEFFKNNTKYHFNVTNKKYPNNPEYCQVADGEIAAELNATEESTIYQRINTVSGSTYTWGLDHRGRDRTDRMVLIIGPEQSVDPSKPSKTGKDQFIRITNWLKTQYGVDYPETDCSQKYTVYSKPFAASGKFVDDSTNEDENISLVETGTINQEWSVWVISSPYCNTNPDESINGWSKYGTNLSDDFDDIMKGASSSLGYDCTYTVPKGQTKTLFAFCSYSSGRETQDDITYGNLLDDINFDLYQPISTSITEGGIGGADVENPDLSNVTIKSDITSGDSLHSVVLDGQYCTIYTKQYNDGKLTDCTFEGAYITVNEADGTPVTKFLKIFDGDISGLTEEEKKTKAEEYFINEPFVDPDTGETWDYYCRVFVGSPVGVHLIYTKAPYVLYDSNGGAPYRFTSNNEYGGNLVGFSDSFQTAQDNDGKTIDTKDYYYNCEYTTTSSGDEVIEVTKTGKYVSHAALPNNDWDNGSAKFCGWSVKDSDGNQIILDGEHTITYDPTTGNGGIVSITDSKNNISSLQLDASHGITLTAVWKFVNTAQAQTRNSESGEFEYSAVGGTVEETLIADELRAEDVKEYTQNVNGEDRVVRAEASGSVGDKIMFKATPDYINDYMFTGWYCINSKTGEYELRTKSTSIAVSVEEGKLNTYYARFEKITFPVIFYYTETGNPANYDYYEITDDNKYGNYFQDVAVGKKAVKPTGDSKSVKTWFTSPTERGTEYIFDFANTKITGKTELYAGPSFAYNYFNFFKIKEPWYIRTYGTVKVDGKYIDLKNDPDVTDYNVYMLKGTLDKSAPTPSDIKSNPNTIKVGMSKNSEKLIYNTLTNTGGEFNRAGAVFSDFYLFNMKTPVWVVFDFTYKGVKYTSTIKDRCLYNNITTYMQEAPVKYYTTYPPKTQAELRTAQDDLLNSIQGMYNSVKDFGITAPSTYFPAVSVSGLTYDSTTDDTYKFSSTTAIRNIEPWGLEYSFNLVGQTVTDFADYGAVVFTDNDGIIDKENFSKDDWFSNQELMNNSVMYSKSAGNVYLSEDESAVEIYYINNMSALNFNKNIYAVFFVKDRDGNTYYSNVISNSYNSVAAEDTSDKANISQSIIEYSNALIAYNSLLEQVTE